MAKRSGTEQSQNCPTVGSGSYGPQSENGREGLVFETVPKHKTEKARRSDLGRLGGSRKTGGKKNQSCRLSAGYRSLGACGYWKVRIKTLLMGGLWPCLALLAGTESKVLNSYLNTEWARGAGNEQLKGGSFVLESYT